jgi:hypothetical protein
MSARAASSALILSLLIAPACFRPAQAGPWLPAPGEYYTELRGGLFSADTYRNDTGDRLSLGGEWEERSLLGTVELGWKKNLSVVIAAPFISATRQDRVGDTTSTSAGLEDLRFGLRLGLHQGPTALAAEFDWQAPLGYGRESSLFARSPRGDGLQQLSLSLLLGRPIAERGFLQLGTGLGFRYLSITRKGAAASAAGPNAAADMWSTPFLASADLGLWLTPSLLLGARYSGLVTLSHGELSPERTLHLAGPALVWRVDDRLDLTAGSWSTAMARNTLHYDQVYVALTFKQTKLNRLQGFLGGTKAP